MSKKRLLVPSLLFLNLDVRRDFAQLQILTTEGELKTALRGNTYKINTITFQDGFTSTGLTNFSDIHVSPELLPPEKHGHSTLNWDRKLAPSHRVSAACLFVLLLVLAALILAYHYKSGENGFEQFMDSQGFGARFLFTLVGVIISFYWRLIFEGICSITTPSSQHHLLSNFRYHPPRPLSVPRPWRRNSPILNPLHATLPPSLSYLCLTIC